jgi:hypothetical protein
VRQMEEQHSQSETARTLRAEAAAVLGIRDQPAIKAEGK